MKRLRHLLEYLAAQVLAAFIRLLPFPAALRAADSVGTLLYWILAKRRRIALENLRAAFGKEKSEAEITAIAKQSFQNLAKVAVECARIPQIARDPERYVHIQHPEILWKLLEAKKGALIIISHFGNWELMAIRAAKEGFQIHSVARPTNNRLLYRTVKRWRGMTGMKTVDKAGAVREVIKLLKQNQVVCMLIDQHERQGAISVDFFGRPAATTTLPALLAVKMGVPAMPGFFYRHGNGEADHLFGEPFKIIRTGDDEKDIRANTEQFMKRIEEEVRKRPGDWLWMHRRWR